MSAGAAILVPINAEVELTDDFIKLAKGAGVDILPLAAFHTE